MLEIKRADRQDCYRFRLADLGYQVPDLVIALDPPRDTVPGFRVRDRVERLAVHTVESREFPTEVRHAMIRSIMRALDSAEANGSLIPGRMGQLA